MQLLWTNDNRQRQNLMPEFRANTKNSRFSFPWIPCNARSSHAQL